MNKIQKNSVIIDEDKVIKKRNDKLISLYDYLDSREFYNHPIITDVKDNIIQTKYIESKENNELINGSELIKTMALLHLKTIKYTDVSKNKYKKIYDKLLGNIEYLKSYYENMISKIESEVFMSPSHYLFARNYSIIDSSLKYSKNTLKTWYKSVENNSKVRISIVHNNISSDHFIKGDKNYFVSFDNYLVDTPILDLYKFYKKEGYKLDFKKLLNIYEETFKLEENEKILLYILISIPPKIEFIKDEFDNCNNVKNYLDYIYSSSLNVN